MLCTNKPFDAVVPIFLATERYPGTDTVDRTTDQRTARAVAGKNRPARINRTQSCLSAYATATGSPVLTYAGRMRKSKMRRGQSSKRPSNA
eukprot:910595-Rhodomonas_salina.1